MTAEREWQPGFAGKVAVLTGAGSGLSQRVAVGLASAGATVVLADINESGLDSTIEAIGRAGRGSAVAVPTDVSRHDDVLALFEAADAHGGVDLLVNAAFILAHRAPEDTSLELWNSVLAVNLTGYFLCAREAGRRMIAQERGGSIVNFSSIAGSTGIGRGNLAYSVSKAAINQLTRELAVEWGRHGIRVNAVQPCQFLTPTVQQWLDDPDTPSGALHKHFVNGIPLGRLGEIDDILGPVLFLLSDAAAMVTGTMLPVDGGNLAMNASGGHPR